MSERRFEHGVKLDVFMWVGRFLHKASCDMNLITRPLILMVALSTVTLTRTDATEQSNSSKEAITALIEKVMSDSKTDREAATQELIHLGKPAAQILVERLSDPSQLKRIAAATALRELLARRKDARPNDHGEAYWRARLAKINFGDRRKDVYRLLPPHPPLKAGEEQAGAAIGTGRSTTEWYRLDDYWSVSVGYHLPDTVSVLPSLRKDPKRIWVDPPKNFTGEWNGWFVNGRKATCNHYKNGKYHGVLTWYRGNGRMIFQQQYKEGVIVGDETGWHANGKKSYAGQYDKNGKRTKTWTHWFETGKMQMRSNYRAGKNHGLSEWWHPNGQLQYQKHYVDGVKHGIDRAFDLGGAVLWERLFENGTLVDR